MAHIKQEERFHESQQRKLQSNQQMMENMIAQSEAITDSTDADPFKDTQIVVNALVNKDNALETLSQNPDFELQTKGLTEEQKQAQAEAVLGEIMKNFAADPMADAMGAIGVINSAANMAVDVNSLLQPPHEPLSARSTSNSVVSRIQEMTQKKQMTEEEKE